MITTHLSLREIEREGSYYRGKITSIIKDMQSRTDLFLEDNVSIFKPGLLLNPGAFQEEFQKQVLTDNSTHIDTLITEMSDVMAKRARVQARTVLDYVGERPRRYSGAIMGTTSDERFESARYEMIDKLKRGTGKINGNPLLTKHYLQSYPETKL